MSTGDQQSGHEAATDGVPNDNTTLLEVLKRLADDGWDQNLSVIDDGQVRCPRCRTASDPSTLTLDTMRRLEGASDPADMLAVLAITCPSCEARGVAVVNYGPEAAEGESMLLRAIEQERR